MTNNMFVPQDVAELLKIRGFDEECVAFYRFGSLSYVSSNEKGANIRHLLKCGETYKDDVIKAPTFMQVQEWMWRKHRMLISIELNERFIDNHRFIWTVQDARSGHDGYTHIKSDESYFTWNDAFNASVKEILTYYLK